MTLFSKGPLDESDSERNSADIVVDLAKNLSTGLARVFL